MCVFFSVQNVHTEEFFNFQVIWTRTLSKDGFCDCVMFGFSAQIYDENPHTVMTSVLYQHVRL